MTSNTTQRVAKRKAEDGDVHARKVRRDEYDAPEFGRETVIVQVGETKDRFDVHTALLTRHSDFFKTALTRPWKERTTRIVDLSEDSADDFELFFRFLYTGQVFSAKQGDFVDKDDGSHTDKEWTRLGSLWNIGQKLLSTSCKDAVTDAMIEKIVQTGKYPTALHRQIYPDGSTSSSIRKLLVDIAVWKWSAPSFEMNRDMKALGDFSADVLLAMLPMRAGGRPDKAPFQDTNTCNYHEHDAEEKPCYKTMF